jgi:hypothetical protein
MADLLSPEAVQPTVTHSISTKQSSIKKLIPFNWFAGMHWIGFPSQY